MYAQVATEVLREVVSPIETLPSPLVLDPASGSLLVESAGGVGQEAKLTLPGSSPVSSVAW